MTKEADIALSAIGARVRDAQLERAADGEERRRRKREILDELEAAEAPVEPVDAPPSSGWKDWAI